MEVVRAVMAKDRRLSVRMIAEETGLDKSAVHRIVTDHLHVRKICAKLVPKNLSVEQKASRLEICQDLLGKLEIEPDLFDKVTTGDESWAFYYDPETKRQSAERHTKSSALPKKALMSRSRVKTVIIVLFFDSRSIVHKEFVPPGQTVNHTFHRDVLKRLRKRVQRFRTDIADDWVLHHDRSASSHCAFNSRISGEEKHSRTSTPSLQPRPSPVRFLPLP